VLLIIISISSQATCSTITNKHLEVVVVLLHRYFLVIVQKNVKFATCSYLSGTTQSGDFEVM